MGESITLWGRCKTIFLGEGYCGWRLSLLRADLSRSFFKTSTIAVKPRRPNLKGLYAADVANRTAAGSRIQFRAFPTNKPRAVGSKLVVGEMKCTSLPQTLWLSLVVGQENLHELPHP